MLFMSDKVLGAKIIKIGDLAGWWLVSGFFVILWA